MPRQKFTPTLERVFSQVLCKILADPKLLEGQGIDSKDLKYIAETMNIKLNDLVKVASNHVFDDNLNAFNIERREAVGLRSYLQNYALGEKELLKEKYPFLIIEE